MCPRGCQVLQPKYDFVEVLEFLPSITCVCINGYQVIASFQAILAILIHVLTK